MVGTNNHRGFGHIRQLSSKRWQASYIGLDGLRHTAPRTFDVKTDAESWLGKERRLMLQDDLDEAQWIPPKEREMLSKAKSVTLFEYGNQEIARRNLQPRTRIQYQMLFDDHIVPILGNLGLNRITPETVKLWHGKTLASKPNYRAQVYNLLKSIFNAAINDGLLQSNPCNIKGAGKITTELQVNLLTVDELATVANEIKPERFKALILLSAWCALRFGEASALQRRDINADCSVLTVARSVTHRKGCHERNTTKSGHRRTVPIPPHIRGDVKAHIESFADNRDDLLFPAPIGGQCNHLNDKTFKTSLIRALKTVGKEDIRIHDLRHFGGTMAATVGSSFEAKGYLGHSTVQMTERYVHMVNGRDQEMAAQMSALTGWSPET